MTTRAVFRRMFQRQPAKSRRRTPRSILSLETLEPRCLLAGGLLVDLGDGITVRGVSRLDDGRGLLVGDYLDPQTGKREGRLFTVAADGASFTSTTLGNLGGDGDTLATDISPNGQYISGVSFSPTSSNRGEGEATIWRLNAPETAIGIGYVTHPNDPINDSVAVSVSNNGVAVGHSNGMLIPFSWEETVGMQALPPGGGPATGGGVSADGSLIVGFVSSGQNSISPSFWAGGALSPLATQGMSGNARDISPNGLYIGGSTNFFDINTFDTVNQATLWIDDDLAIAADQTASDYRIALLTDENGNPFDGEVYGVSDNGYAVGGSNAYIPEAEHQGFIWHESFAGVRLFDEWLLAEYGITLPTPSRAINDVFFDGLNLSFAVLGSSYFVTVPLEAEPPLCEDSLNSIAGFVYLDANSNGVKDSGEAGLSGVTITLSGPVQRTVFTDADGSYRFEELPDGVYAVSQGQPSGYVDGIDTPGQPLLGSVENDRFFDLPLSCNAELLNYNFGERLPAGTANSISGVVYVDVNDNGHQDPAEFPLPNVTISITGPVQRSTLTGMDGRYRFTDLPDGVYTVTQTQPAGFLDGIDVPGQPLLGRVENNRFVDLNLSGGIGAANYNFGERGILSPSKAQFLASTPEPTPLMLARLAGPDGGRWFSLVSGEDAALTVSAGDGTTSMALYTEARYPVAEGEQGSLQALVTGGAVYLLRLDAEGEFSPVIETAPFDTAGSRGFHNAVQPLDVSGDGLVSPLDVLQIVNELNSWRIIDGQGRFLVHPTAGSTLPHCDTNGDGRLTAVDALVVINGLNARVMAEGEAWEAIARAEAADTRFTPVSAAIGNGSFSGPEDSWMDELDDAFRKADVATPGSDPTADDLLLADGTDWDPTLDQITDEFLLALI